MDLRVPLQLWLSSGSKNSISCPSSLDIDSVSSPFDNNPILKLKSSLQLSSRHELELKQADFRLWWGCVNILTWLWHLRKRVERVEHAVFEAFTLGSRPQASLKRRAIMVTKGLFNPFPLAPCKHTHQTTIALVSYDFQGWCICARDDHFCVHKRSERREALINVCNKVTTKACNSCHAFNAVTSSTPSPS